MPGATGGAVFISHSHADREIAEPLFQLLRSTLPGASIHYTSHANHGAAPGAAFLDDFRQKLIDSRVVLALLSENYLASTYCMCELGGAWVKDLELIPLLAPGITAAMIPAPIANRLAIGLEGVQLDRLRDRFGTLGFSLQSGPDWRQARRTFLETIRPRLHPPLPPYGEMGYLYEEFNRLPLRQREARTVNQVLDEVLSQPRQPPVNSIEDFLYAAESSIGKGDTDALFWWLIYRGVYQFRSAHEPAMTDSTSDKNWPWRTCLSYVEIAPRGLVYLEWMAASAHQAA